MRNVDRILLRIAQPQRGIEQPMNGQSADKARDRGAHKKQWLDAENEYGAARVFRVPREHECPKHEAAKEKQKTKKKKKTTQKFRVPREHECPKHKAAKENSHFGEPDRKWAFVPQQY